VAAEMEKASEAKSDLTNGMTSKALVEDHSLFIDILFTFGVEDYM